MTTPAVSDAEPSRTHDRGGLALVLSGGGARGAYQVGVLRHLATRLPELRVPIITGVSSGAVNALHLAQHTGTFRDAVEELVRLWSALTPGQVFEVDAFSLVKSFLRWGVRLVSGGAFGGVTRTRGLVDTEPLRRYLRRVLRPVKGRFPGIEENLRRGRLKAVALSTTSYTTGQSVVWVEGREIEEWERPKRRAVHTALGIEHVMASAALPLVFPAVRIGDAWYGDGGIRLAAPLSPALHLGAHKILAISPRYESTREEADAPDVVGYPPPAQVLGLLFNAIFLDLIDQDVARLERANEVLRHLRPEDRQGYRIVDILVVRPSRDLGRIAAAYEPRLPRAFRFATRGTGTRETTSPDLLSLLMFQDDYLKRLIELGESDAEARSNELVAFVAGRAASHA
jgi:NTE family protein